jgi:hypothetical protein
MISLRTTTRIRQRISTQRQRHEIAVTANDEQPVF